MDNDSFWWLIMLNSGWLIMVSGRFNDGVNDGVEDRMKMVPTTVS